MPWTFSKTAQFALGSISSPENASLTMENNIQSSIPAPVGKTGELTTRTDNDTGTLTMDSAGHGILTGDKIDLYWSGGRRRNMTVGTVSGTSVPIDLGEGDNLPVAATDVVATVVVSQPFACVGDDLKAIVASFSGGDGISYCQVSFMNGTTVLGAIQLAPGQGYSWYSTSGVTNILAGDTVTAVQVSNGSSTVAATINVGVGYD